MKRTALAGAIALASLQPIYSGEAKVYQGELRDFESPMVIEIPAEPMRDLSEKQWVVEDFADYFCNDVAIRKIVVEDLSGFLAISLTVYDRGLKDKDIALTTEVIDGNQVLLSWDSRKETDERKDTEWMLTKRWSKKKLRSFLEGLEEPVLRLTLMVEGASRRVTTDR